MKKAKITKVKTNKTLLKKIKITGTGKILRSHQLRSGHLKQNKSKSAIRRYKVPQILDKSLAKKIKKMLKKGGIK
jgi:large subunit ribosomal protein L35